MFGMKEDATANRSQSFKEVIDEDEPGDAGFAKITLIGSLGKLSDGSRIDTLRVDAPDILGHLLKCVEQKYGIALKRDSMLALVNGVEANALDDLGTLIHPEDVVVLIPMFHGG